MTVLERPQPRPGVLKIQAYVPGKSSAPGAAKVFKLSSNETPLGPSPHAIASSVAANAARGAVRKAVVARIRPAMLSLIASSDIVKMC